MPITPFKPRLVLRVIWTAEFPNGSEFARHIYSRLCRDSERPSSRGLGIPVYFHTSATPAAAGLPDALDLDAAESTVIVVLIDTSIKADEAWRDCVRGIESRIAARGKRHLYLPVACEDKVHTVVDKANCIRLYEFEPKYRQERLISALTHELARLLLAKGADVKTED